MSQEETKINRRFLKVEGCRARIGPGSINLIYLVNDKGSCEPPVYFGFFL
jgi:hypothetical protein